MPPEKPMHFWAKGTQRYQSTATQTDAEAFEDLFAHLVHDIGEHGPQYDVPDSVPEVFEGPDALIATLTNIGDNDLLKVLAMEFHQGQKRRFKCFYCNAPGHTWSRCQQLWDVLKKNGVTARPRLNSTTGTSIPMSQQSTRKSKGEAGSSHIKASCSN